MKKLTAILFFVFSSSAFAQTAQEYYHQGNLKSQSQDYAGSIVEYDKAISIDSTFIDAYYNRGSSKLYMKNYQSAIFDFDKVLQLRPEFVKGYSNRGIAKLKMEDFKGALSDWDEAIKLDPQNASVFFMRGQVKIQTDDKPGGCADLSKAKELGDSRADKYLNQYCNQPVGKESFLLVWPENEHWKVGDDQENETQRVVDLIHSDESVDKWTELGNMTTIKGVKGVPMDKAMNLMYEQSKEHAPKAKLTFIEMDTTVEYPWIIFTIEAPGFKDDRTPESQLWYIVQGKNSLYTNFVAVKKATLSTEFKDKWIRFFKRGKVVAG